MVVINQSCHVEGAARVTKEIKDIINLPDLQFY